MLTISFTSSNVIDNLNSIHLDFKVVEILYPELFVSKKKSLLFGSSIDFNKAFDEFILRFSTSYITINLSLLLNEERF